MLKGLYLLAQLVDKFSDRLGVVLWEFGGFEELAGVEGHLGLGGEGVGQDLGLVLAEYV